MLNDSQSYKLQLFRDTLLQEYKELSKRKESIPDEDCKDQVYQAIRYSSLKDRIELLDSILLQFDNLVESLKNG